MPYPQRQAPQKAAICLSLSSGPFPLGSVRISSARSFSAPRKPSSFPRAFSPPPYRQMISRFSFVLCVINIIPPFFRRVNAPAAGKRGCEKNI